MVSLDGASTLTGGTRVMSMDAIGGVRASFVNRRATKIHDDSGWLVDEVRVFYYRENEEEKWFQTNRKAIIWNNLQLPNTLVSLLQQ